MRWILKTSSILLNVLMLQVNIGDFDWSRVLQHLSYIAWVSNFWVMFMRFLVLCNMQSGN
jgi:hypothetical protein